MNADHLLLWGIVIHLIIDWLFQNDWIARNKANLRHPAGWLHAIGHGVGLALLFPWYYAALIALLHLIIDTRIPLAAWRRLYRQTEMGDVALHVAIWCDQVAHIAVIALFALIAAHRG